MAATYPPSKKAKPLEPDFEFGSHSYFKSGKGRDRALMDLFYAGHTVEQISRWSCLPLGRLMQILGAEQVVSDLFLHSRWSLKRIAKESGLTLADVARLVGGRTRSSKHVEAEEDVDELDYLRNGKSP